MEMTRSEIGKPVRVHTNGQRTRLRILEAAGQVFAANGYGKTGMRGIAREGGIILSSLVYHFGTKEKLFEETIRYHVVEKSGLETLFDPLVSGPARQTPQTVADALRKVVRNFLEVCHGPQRVPLLDGLLLHALTDGNRQACSLVRELFERPRQQVFERLRQVSPSLAGQDVESWFQLFRAEVLYLSVARTLILAQHGWTEYPPGWLDFTAHRIAWHCCLPLGLPEPSVRVAWDPATATGVLPTADTPAVGSVTCVSG
ncbi:MAG: TetR/AcrR family transcriptional regulator [Opitutaceae bacterium]|nr:TetR/AcrR family transcriptional regulator [Opitutaceae bacterium]